MKYFFLLFFLVIISHLSAQTSGSLTVTVTTSNTGMGGYAPSYVVAVWLEDNSNKFVKTLLQFGLVRYYNLDKWVTASAENKVDAITGATLTSQAIKICKWNSKDVLGNVVADGDYKIKMQLTDDEFSGISSSYTFSKGTNAQTITPSDVLPSFKNVSIKWMPSTTAIDELKIGKQYSVFPNPTRSTAYITGYDIVQIELCALNGSRIYSTQNQQLDLSGLSKGFYVAKIKTKVGVFIKKIEKI